MTAELNTCALPGQPFFAYQGNDLMVEGVRLAELALQAAGR